MKVITGNDCNGEYIVLKPKSKRDYYTVGCMSKQISHNMTWAREAADDGDFKPIQMKIYVDKLLDYLVHSQRTDV